jgi:F0F1-type ATP synthase membrane subunit b/b'
MAKTREMLERERDSAVRDLRRGAAVVAVGAAERLLKRGADKALHDRLVAEMVTELEAANGSAKKR